MAWLLQEAQGHSIYKHFFFKFLFWEIVFLIFKFYSGNSFFVGFYYFLNGLMFIVLFISWLKNLLLRITFLTLNDQIRSGGKLLIWFTLSRASCNIASSICNNLWSKSLFQHVSMKEPIIVFSISK